ncbi:hypothetical protein, partial [Pseudomonas aeruginosa]|uniref:hypothetical protein n=1 Tax=Pseudomonas aeruginosa TaxID=287 RepID=UPI003CF429D2
REETSDQVIEAKPLPKNASAIRHIIIIGSLVSSLAPMRLIGLTGGVFNFGGGLGGITVPLVVGKVADIASNPYGVSWQNLVDSQRIMDITLNEFNTHPTAFICTNIQETDLAGHAEDVARYAERLQVVDRNLASLRPGRTSLSYQCRCTSGNFSQS